ncbi:MAG TPA: toll/interleukin-1 receptor domain-containing protein, partial [Thiolinea sp.]|nr:toll/interleukin-1 receptor domain-containing protein [Thiolinea sp.]
IFISYRRDDTGYIAGMLAERLEEAFGKRAVFIDVDAIPLGVDFREHLNQAVTKSDLMLALIGDDWLNVKNAQGLRRLDDPADFVRIEIEAALKHQIPVIPVLVAQAVMPLENELPPSLQSLAFRNAAEIRSGRDLNYHIEQLIKGLKNHYAASSSAAFHKEDRAEYPLPQPKSEAKHHPAQAAAHLPPDLNTGSVPSKFNAKRLGALLIGLGSAIALVLLLNHFVGRAKTTNPAPVDQPKPADYPSNTLALNADYFKPCVAGTRNLIVGSGYSTQAEALARLKKFRAQYPNYKFKLLKTVDPTNNYSNDQSAIVVGHGMDLDTAVRLLTNVRSAGIAPDAYLSNQAMLGDCV